MRTALIQSKQDWPRTLGTMVFDAVAYRLGETKKRSLSIRDLTSLITAVDLFLRKDPRQVLVSPRLQPALSVTRAGAQPSMPTMADVNQLLFSATNGILHNQDGTGEEPR